MKGFHKGGGRKAFTSLEMWIFIIMILILVAVVTVGLLNRFGMIDSPFQGKKEEVDCEKPVGSTDLTAFAKPYIVAQDSGFSKARELRRTAGISPDSGLDLEQGQIIYVEFDTDNPWNGCYRIEDERKDLKSGEIGFFVGSERVELEEAKEDIGRLAKAYIWKIGSA